MLKFYYFKKKIYRTLHILVSGLQILLSLTVLLVSLYWLLELLGLHFIDFVQPLADLVRGFVKIFYKRMIVVNEIEVDGSILLFDIIAFIVIIAASHVNTFFKKEIQKTDIIFDKLANDEEKKFNKQLQTDYESEILKNHNVGVLISYSLKNILGSSFWSEHEESLTSDPEVDKQIYLLLSKFSGCKVSKSGTQFLLYLKDFEKTDTLIYYLNSLFTQVEKFVSESHRSFTAYTSIHSFDDKTNIKEVLTMLNKLLSLKIPNKIICIGEFRLRYELLKNKKYSIQLTGDYFIPPDIKVYSVVKKY